MYRIFVNRKKTQLILCLSISFLLIFIPNLMIKGEIISNKSINDSSSLDTEYTNSWITVNGSVIRLSIDPIVSSLQNEETYLFNVTVKSLAFAPNQTSFSAINVTLRFQNSINNIYSESHLFSNLTSIGSTESKFIPLFIPAIEDIPMRSTQTVHGNLQYLLRYNETFTLEEESDYLTGWRNFASTTLRDISDSLLNAIVFLLLLGGGLIFIIYIYNRNKKGKRKFQQNAQQTQNFVGEGYQRSFQQQNQSQPLTQQQISQQYQQPQVLSQQIAFSQEIIVCRNCTSLNLPSTSNCISCGRFLSVQSIKKTSFLGNISYQQLSIIVLVVILVLETFFALIVTELFVSSGYNLNFSLDIDGDIIKTTDLYRAFARFIVPFHLILIIISTFLLNIFLFFIMKRKIIHDQSLNLYQVRSIKRYFLYLPVISFSILFLPYFLFSSGEMLGNKDFILSLTTYGVLIGFLAFPIRIWIHKRKFVLPKHHVVIPSTTTQIYTQMPVNTSNSLLGNQMQPSSPTPLQSSAVPPNLQFICSNCKNTISKTVTFCPECGSKTERCSICKSPFESVHDKVQCPKCNSPFHMPHFQESLKVTGKCPVCKEAVQSHEIKKEY